MSVKRLPPMWLEANDPEDLRELMIINNRRFNRQFHYFDIQAHKNKWYCWFELSEKDRIEQVADGEES